MSLIASISDDGVLGLWALEEGALVLKDSTVLEEEGQYWRISWTLTGNEVCVNSESGPVILGVDWDSSTFQLKN